MIGKTNSSQGVSSIPSEYVNIRMMTNQASHGDLVGAKFVLSYEKFSQEYVWGGSEMTFQVPAYVVCTIEWGDVEGYKKPEAVTFTSVEDNARTIEVEYQCELLTVNVSADEGVPTGFEVTISKQETVGVATKYTRLEYIQGTGTSYIDTGFTPNQNTRVTIECGGCTKSGWLEIFGSGSSVRNPSKNFLIVSNIEEGAQMQYDTSYHTSAITNVKDVIDVDKNKFYINGSLVNTFTSSSFTSPYTLALFQGNTSGNDYPYYEGKVYSCKIYDNGILVRDYIPALRKDGIAGLYDLANDSFYASSGSDAFIAGPSIGEVIHTQVSALGTYKIPFDVPYNIEASDIDGFETPEPISRVASEKAYVATMEYKAIGAKDLSLMDVYGNKIQRSTANCYVVREAGRYKFPLVFGNAIKNGKVNTAAFTNNGGTYSHDFVYGTPYTSYESDVITQPYINPYFALSSSDVQIETSDVDGAITDLGLEDGNECKFVTFKVANVPSTGGNVIITLNTAYGDYWSWHIWLWPHDLSPVEITNATGVKYKIMPVNLASKYDSDGVHIKNWFYQWGRPNPMLCPNAWNSTTDHSPGVIAKTSKADTLKIGIMNPSKFYYNSASPYNWFGTKSYYNLWDAACARTGSSDNDTVKTVYDPCPVGWKVPNGNTFTGFSLIQYTGNEVFLSRYAGDEVGARFPISGLRDNAYGVLSGVGTYSFIWTSASSAQTHAYRMRIQGSTITKQDYGVRATGSSIRPVQDDNIQLDVIMISFTIGGTTYQAESGMTWFEWVNSSYNTGGFYLFYDPSMKHKVAKTDLSFVSKTRSGTNVYSDEGIIGGSKYYVVGL